MWLVTPIGFFSIVQKPGDKKNGTLTVRSRVRSDLAALKQPYLSGLGTIKESHDTDYRFRAVAPRAEVSAAMARMIDGLDYSNFKSEVAKKQGHKRASLYHQVWDVLYHLQTDPAFAEKEPVAESYGGVVISGGRKVLLREPTKRHGGYAWTFAKTEAKPGESPRDAAVRAVREKTGYDADIRISIPGAFKGSASSTCYYVMDVKHPPAKPNWQTAALRWVNFDVGFAFDPKGGAYVTDVVVNRENREYSNTDDDEDLKLLEEIIRYHLLQPLEEPEVDGFVKAMSLAMQPKYLGSPEVVTALVKEVFDVAIRVIAEEATEDDFVEAVGKVIAAFTDDDAGYTRMPGWHSAEQMGGYVKKYLIGSDQGECLAEILGHGMTALIAKLQEMLGGFIKDPAANWEEHALVQLNALHQFVVTVLLGTNAVVSGEKTLGDFKWMPIGADAGGKQVIVEVGSEGGSLTLYGIQSPEGWRFKVETSEAALVDDEDEPDMLERPWVATWRSALKQLGGYPWTQLYPLAVHPDFREKVFKALQTRKKKGLVIDWDQWGCFEHHCRRRIGRRYACQTSNY